MTLFDDVAPIHRFVEIYVDGGVLEANPSPRGVYWSMRVEDGDANPVVERFSSSDHKTNNEAEWLALREALRRAVQKYKTRAVVVYSDSQLIVNQFNGRYAIREARLKPLWSECRMLFGDLNFVSVQMPMRRCPRCGLQLMTPHRRRCPNEKCNAPLPPGWRPREIMLEKLGH